MNWREATVADAHAVAAVATAHEHAVDPAASAMGHDGAVSFIQGYADRCTARVFDNAGNITAVVNLHPDSNRQYLFPDVYVAPGSGALDSALDLLESWAARDYPRYEHRPGANVRDDALRGAFRDRGYAELRTFWTMRRTALADPFPDIPAPYRLEKISVDDESALREWHAAHQDAFAHHFGFAPRSFDSWRELIVDEPTLDRDGVFLLYDGDRAVAFVECSLEGADESRGYIALLGVIDDYRGKGLGELSLRVGLARSKELGFASAELNVDSGNESGALRLYEKTGFTADSAWVQHVRVSA